MNFYSLSHAVENERYKGYILFMDQLGVMRKIKHKAKTGLSNFFVMLQGKGRLSVSAEVPDFVLEGTYNS